MKLADATSEMYRSKFTPIEAPRPVQPPVVPVNPTPLEPLRSSLIRCPLPQISSSPDSLRQFYTGGVVPQTRLIPARTLTN